MAPFPAPEAVLKAWQDARRPNIVVYQDLNLVVKVGLKRVRFEEAIAMLLVREFLPGGEVPVPTVYGWRVRGLHSLLYMSYVPGSTLLDVWDTLITDEKQAISEQLGLMIKALRSIPAGSKPAFIRNLESAGDRAESFIGSASYGPLRDIFLRWSEQTSDYEDVKSFHDMLSEVAIPASLRSDDFVDPYRELFPDNCKVYFTHADLNLSNIMVAGPPGLRRITSIIDWEQSGWYPEYWEYCKIHLSSHDEHEWRAGGWADKVTQNYEDEFFALAEYWQARPP